MEDSKLDLELEHLYLVLSDEQFNKLLDFYPIEIRDIDRTQIHLVAYWRGDKYGMVHAITDNPS